MRGLSRLRTFVRGLVVRQVGDAHKSFRVGLASKAGKDLDKEKYDLGGDTPSDPSDPVSDETTKLESFMKSGAKDIDPSKMSLWDLEKKGAVPGFREDFTTPTKYETAVGWERYELLCDLTGKEPWADFRAIPLTRRPTPDSPLKIKSVDPVFYIGCSGYPVESHELLWLTLSPHGQLDRCPQCGNCFKYTQIEVPSHDLHH